MRIHTASSTRISDVGPVSGDAGPGSGWTSAVGGSSSVDTGRELLSRLSGMRLPKWPFVWHVTESLCEEGVGI